MGAEKGASGFSLVVIFGVVCNVLSVVGVVICNKYIIDVDDFRFSVFLSFLHFAATALGMHLLLCADFFHYKAAPLSGVLPVAIGSLLSVAFMNLNLAHNSVGFYQVRISWTPLPHFTLLLYRTILIISINWNLITICLFRVVVEVGVYPIHVVRPIYIL
jgi:solute carrier family 35, member E3